MEPSSPTILDHVFKWLPVISTFVIAVFSFASYRLASRIKEQSIKRDKEVKELLNSLVAATLAGSRLVGEPKFAARQFHEQLRELENFQQEAQKKKSSTDQVD